MDAVVVVSVVSDVVFVVVVITDHIWIVSTFFEFIWIQTEFRLVTNQLEKLNYKTYLFNSFSALIKLFICVQFNKDRKSPRSFTMFH